jgi:putative spermidine/putrescine transport system ATP-binding protein
VPRLDQGRFGVKGASVELVDVAKRFGATTAVDGINLRIPAGSYCCLLGPSGCGKTTTLRMIAGHERVTEGDILIEDRNVTELPPAARGTAMMFQSYALFPHMSVVENVGFAMRVQGKGKAARRAAAMERLALVEMEGFADRRPAALSGGQQQRVALARALVTDPEVLLLDEPLSALDPTLRLRMRAELKRLQHDLGLTFVHVTHSQEEAMALSELVVVMRDGRIEQAGTPRQIFERPATPFVARFLGAHNVLAGHGGSMSLRSDQLRIVPEGGGKLGATVSSIEYQGHYLLVRLAAEGQEELTAILPDDALDGFAVEPGDPVGADWRDEDLIPLAGGDIHPAS